jgi:hypothetical protein
MPKSSLYRNKLDWLRIEYQNYTEQTPYYEFDQEFRDMIVADDSLTTDQKLELIIKNHKGFIRNLDIGDLAMDTASELTKIEAEEMFYDMYGEDEFSTNPFTYYNGKEGEVRSFERVFLYDDNIFISYDSNSFGKDTGERFVEDIISSFEILKHRLPLIYDNILAPSDDNYSQINLIDSRHNAAATSYFSSERGRIVFYPTYVNFADRYDTNETNEIILSTIMHESIHNSIKSEKMQNFEYGDERFRNIVEIFEEDGGKSEILTTSSQVFLDEILNMSYSGGSLDAISVWYGVYNREDIWNGKDPMDYFIRIIDNRLGQ